MKDFLNKLEVEMLSVYTYEEYQELEKKYNKEKERIDKLEHRRNLIESLLSRKTNA
jgi:hypothetical protein